MYKSFLLDGFRCDTTKRKLGESERTLPNNCVGHHRTKLKYCRARSIN